MPLLPNPPSFQMPQPFAGGVQLFFLNIALAALLTGLGEGLRVPAAQAELTKGFPH
jgi:hypothetical protein